MPFSPALSPWYLTGPTASGKTRVGIELARRLGAEIVSLDSMAIYRGLDIGTAKPTAEQRQAVPHHLLDIVEPTEDFSLSQYVERAHATIDEIRGRGKEVLFVGGTPLYLKSLLRGIFAGPPADWEFRRQVEAEAARVGAEKLHARLRQVDPLSAARLQATDIRRIVRALEVYKLTGQPISHLQDQFDVGHAADECRVFVLQWPRPVLHQRIALRVEQMFAAGLFDEVQSLLARYGQLGRTASQAVGYREVMEHLAGSTAREVTIERVIARTRQFAKRQLTWFRSLRECREVPLDEGFDAAAVAERIVSSASN